MSKWRAKALELFPDMRHAIEAVGSPGELWIELSARLQTHYTSSLESESQNPPDYARNVHLYALWCASARDWHVREAASIEFFENIVPFAIRCGKPGYNRIVQDLVTCLGVPNIKKCSASFGYSISPEQLQNFLRDADEFSDRLRRKSKKK